MPVSDCLLASEASNRARDQVLALAARWVVDGRMSWTGAGGLASLVDPGPFLAALADRGVKAAIFEGAGASANQS